MPTRKVFAGSVAIGGGAPVSVQTMTNTDTRDVEATLAQIRAMVARRGEDKPYLVIVPYWGGFRQEKKDAIKAAFGRHAVEFPVEPKLCYRNRPDVHLNENGYALLAKLLHERGAELGYWPAK